MRSLLLLPLFAVFSLRASAALAAGCATVAWSEGGPLANGQFGRAVAIGDVNNDGYADLLVGSPGSDNASLYLGTGASPPNPPLHDSPAWTFTGQTGSLLGLSVAIGDVNGDGWNDLVVSAPQYVPAGSTGDGGVFVFLGGSSGISTTPNPLWTVTGIAGASFGASLSVGDINGDGRADLVIGAPNENGHGQAYVLWGNPAIPGSLTPLWSPGSPPAGSSFGASVSLFDGNGDHHLEVAVGAPGTASMGEVRVFHLGTTIPPAFAATSNAISGESVGDQFGATVQGVADVDGDGRGDLLVGTPNHASVGRAYLFRADATQGLNPAPAWTADGDLAGGRFGVSLATSDVDGDGHGDALVGADNAGVSGRVSLFLWHFGPSGGTFAATPTRQFESELSGSHFGAAIAGGYLDPGPAGDFVVGAPTFTNAVTTGKVYAYISEPNVDPCPSLPPICVGPDLIAWWQAEGNASDAAGTHNGSLQGGVTFAWGEVLKAFSLDGATGSIAVPDDAAFAFSNAITLEAWINTTSGTDRYIATKHEDSFYFAVGGGSVSPHRVSFWLNGVGSSWLTGSTVVDDGQWHHVAATYDGSAMKVYVDGNLDGSSLRTGTIQTGTSGILIGARSDGLNASNFPGMIDELAIHDRALSASEIENIYAHGKSGRCGVVGVGDASQPHAFEFASPWPNPSARATHIAFQLPARANVRAEVVDVAGRRVASLADGAMEAGMHRMQWDGRDGAGNLVAPGVYLVRVSAGAVTVTHQIVVIR